MRIIKLVITVTMAVFLFAAAISFLIEFRLFTAPKNAQKRLEELEPQLSRLLTSSIFLILLTAVLSLIRLFL